VASGVVIALRLRFPPFVRPWNPSLDESEKMNVGLLMAGLLGASAVAAGAFGAHALEAMVTPERLAIWTTAANYHLVHSVVVLALALQPHQALWRRTIQGFVLGIGLFSFSLYALVLTDLSMLAMLTPFGGLLLMGSWLTLVFKAQRLTI
jgi:uncharacterized membrane protein YgdD (TMEM256/DUF423 family)